ncbi:hypothetical protein SAMN05216296_0804 [Pseudomonas pohangensis]|uniref:Uncharacterized protein n=1 Tax=Pseudomonas pohangensis TaxID=364197 RepID=A0A1H2EHY7_9PSED|nr:DUF6685 family protein [Pseudomonas pohangensis]SDT94756.1 hypothetical protein SAMN05216296_0804 [Pseudomonas pohangensis]
MSATPPPTMSSRLANLTQKLGLSGRSSRNLLERAAELRLPFEPLTIPPESICWNSGAPLQDLPELPRSALSGPVQDDKSAAHAVLVRLIERHTEEIETFDLRQIDGLTCSKGNLPPCASLEQYLAGVAQRQIRIISYKDFVKAISLPLPNFLRGHQINLRQANWHGKRIFWSGEQQAEAFASAIVYARRREMEVHLPAELTTYQISQRGLKTLDISYHILAMPAQAWSHADFMRLLVDTGLPYARLSLKGYQTSTEFLMLPKHNTDAVALGEGLLLAGAPDVSAFLHQLASSANA